MELYLSLLELFPLDFESFRPGFVLWVRCFYADELGVILVLLVRDVTAFVDLELERSFFKF